MTPRSFSSLSPRAIALPAILMAGLLLAASSHASNLGWQSVAASCVPTAQSSKLAVMPATKFGGLTTGAVAFKSGEVGTITLVCPVDFNVTGTNPLDQLSLVARDNTPDGSVTATLMRMDKLTGVSESLGSVTSVDLAGIGTRTIGFTPSLINFFSHSVYVVLKISRSDPLADVQANMAYLSRFIP